MAKKLSPIGLALIEMEAVALACEYLEKRLDCNAVESRQLLIEFFAAGMPALFQDDLSDLLQLARRA
jgi:hypothetical protein